MLSELEFSKERYRQFLMVMHLLDEESASRANSQAEYEALIDELLDKMLKMQRDIRRLERKSDK